MKDYIQINKYGRLYIEKSKFKEAITKGRVYQCRLCGKRYIERTLAPQCQHDFLLVELKQKEK